MGNPRVSDGHGVSEYVVSSMTKDRQGVSRFALRASNSLTILSLAAEVPKCSAHPTNDELECYS